ncbi:YibE/F family protein [Brooklawnia cerclae]|uniref:Membrane protein n=1 Tax=Brooklawnia cerclae TaxID=349934 RepID=A0ABX0SGM7_9ACTN|nr:YibE/F family protein [Brooklawnia cerclae]NIH57145.1 putative membrane protein [Brooklawnia cerclae]
MSHTHDHGGPAPASRAVVVGLAAVMAALFVATVIAVVMLWPSTGDLPAKRPVLYEGAEQVTATVVAIENPGSLQDGQNAEVVVRLDDSGEQTTIELSPTIASDDIIGASVRLVATPGGTETSGLPSYLFLDFHRGVPLLALAAVFAIAVVAVARVKGFAALCGLVGALAMIWFFTLPALLAGRPSLLVALVTASAVLFIVVYLAHGVSVKSSTALLGTFAGIALVTALAAWAIPASHLTPGVSEEMSQLAYYAPLVDVRGVLLCGMVLGGVGVLNDVTITQASSVWELRAAAPHDTRWKIFARAMRIGRDHIASTVYTIAFAYVGGALGLLLLASTLDHKLADLVTYDEIAEELVSIAVASIGLVLTIPLTTAIAAAMAGGPRPEETAEETPAREDPPAPTPDQSYWSELRG